MSIPTEKAFFSIKEFAIYLSVSEQTVRRLIKKGRISAFRLSGGPKSGYRIPHSEISRIALFDMEEMIEKIIEKRKNENGSETS